ncbi:hypothetical protein VTL71DRAFT_10850 [Oculimacula yallundae]|uniref:Uncharacterized protein n=1 Tax=Oculimacula yallundae TaxID=86028 RepID=A0ABR4CU82_9HELO
MVERTDDQASASDSHLYDESILEDFKDTFEDWELDDFRLPKKNILRDLVRALRDGGICVITKGSLSDALFGLLSRIKSLWLKKVCEIYEHNLRNRKNATESEPPRPKPTKADAEALKQRLKEQKEKEDLKKLDEMMAKEMKEMEDRHAEIKRRRLAGNDEEYYGANNRPNTLREPPLILYEAQRKPRDIIVDNKP